MPAALIQVGRDSSASPAEPGSPTPRGLVQLNRWHRIVIAVENAADLTANSPSMRTSEGCIRIYVDGAMQAECRGLAFSKHPGFALHNPFLLGDPFASHQGAQWQLIPAQERLEFRRQIRTS